MIIPPPPDATVPSKTSVVKTMTEDFGNPSAMHLKGVDAEKYVKEATKTIAGILKVQEKEILFTSGGTESDNLALMVVQWQTNETETTSSSHL